MKRSIAISLVTATMAFGTTNSDFAALKTEIEALKKEVAALKEANAEIQKTGSALKKLDNKVNEIKAHDANDNIKWGVDIRTAVDSLNYTMADGTKKSNDALMSTRLWLNMAYAPDANNIFKGQLAYNKAFGADFGGAAGSRGWGMDTFDWVTNEALSGNSLKVKEAYWLYMGDSIGEANIPWTASVGRRPSTNGFLVNLRDDDSAQSPLGHNINVEFDGASAGVNLENVSEVPGMNFKVCLGQGSTSATPMFGGPANYSDDNSIDDITMAGFIFVPYDDGQYSIKTNYFRAYNLPGMVNPMDPTAGFKTVGNMDGLAISGLIDGIGEDGILSEAKLFASFAMSKTNPDNVEAMLGSSDSKTGTSYWAGIQVPLWDGDFGLEYNHGSKYWRSFTYGEDTMVGSKLAARGDAWEAYYTYPITKALSLQARYTYIDYDYSGSNSFFGSEGAPMTMDQANTIPGMGGMVVDKASDLRFYVRYRY
ncbi:MAG: DUF3373 family protein [Sulfurovaceae bacterium]